MWYHIQENQRWGHWQDPASQPEDGALDSGHACWADPWPVGEYIHSEADGKGPRIKLHLPDPNNKGLVCQYHNKLMSLCNLAFAPLSEKMVSVASKAPRRKDRAKAVVDAAKEEPKVEEGAAGSSLVVPAAPPLSGKRKRQIACKSKISGAASSSADVLGFRSC